MRLAVLMPARDEAPRIGAVLAAVRNHLPGADAWVIDDGGLDGTADVARAAGATILSTTGLGYAGALRTGYRALVAHDYDVVVQMDADGQHPPSSAPLLVGQLAHANLVVGSRHGTASPAGVLRRWGNGVLAGGVRTVTGARLRDVTSGYWAVDRAAIGLLAEHLPGDVADANVRVLAVRRGMRVVEVPVAMPGREQGRSMHAGLAGASNFARSLRAIWRAAREG